MDAVKKFHLLLGITSFPSREGVRERSLPAG